MKVDRGSSVLLGADGALMHVRTPLAVVRHLGTQFEVRLQDEGLRVRVREGSVAVENADGRRISRDEWSWVNELAPPFVLEGSTLSAFLEWARLHHGLRTQYGRSRAARSHGANRLARIE